VSIANRNDHSSIELDVMVDDVIYCTRFHVEFIKASHDEIEDKNNSNNNNNGDNMSHNNNTNHTDALELCKNNQIFNVSNVACVLTDLLNPLDCKEALAICSNHFKCFNQNNNPTIPTSEE
jgi:hypothetical protein